MERATEAAECRQDIMSRVIRGRVQEIVESEMGPPAVGAPITRSPAGPLPPGRVAGSTASSSGGPLPAGRVGPFVGPAERSDATECL
eukprot:84626-Alexandrium_andersonii.AAC.1